MSGKRLQTFSLRRRLQASSLLAVLAGYAVLLIANRELAQRARLERDRQALDQVREELLQHPAAAAQPAALQVELARIVSPGRLLWLEDASGRPLRLPQPDTPFRSPLPLPQLIDRAALPPAGSKVRMLRLDGREYLTSSQLLGPAAAGLRLRSLEDVTEDRERERRMQLLLLAAAGLTALLTSALLRLVLR